MADTDPTLEEGALPNPVVHFEITARNQTRLQEFYTRLFDWQIHPNPAMSYAMIHTHADGGIDGGIAPARDKALLTMYVQVPDLQAALDRAESLGGRTVMPPIEIPNAVSLAMLADPEGNVIGLIKG